VELLCYNVIEGLVVKTIPTIIFFTFRTLFATAAWFVAGTEVSATSAAATTESATASTAAAAAVATTAAEATASAATVTTEATASAAASAATATWTELTFWAIFSFFYHDCGTIKLCSIQRIHSLAAGFMVCHFDKTITFGATSFPIHNYFGRGYLAELFKSCLQILIGGPEIELGYKNVHNKINDE
jgi:hypothetical protein